MTRRLQFSLRTALLFVFVMAIVAWPTSIWVRNYLASRGLVPVRGLVTYMGQPLQDAKVIMVPAKAGAKPIEGLTNARGEYATATLAVPGDYAVGITETGTAKRRVSPKYASGATSGIIVSIRPTGENYFAFEVSY